MPTLFQRLEAFAAYGAGGLDPDARREVARGLFGLWRDDGGFAGLDGRSDPYFTFFAWLGLRALGAAFDCERVCAYMRARRRDAGPVDAVCIRLVLAADGRGAGAPGLRLAAALLRDCGRGGYPAFAGVLASGAAPRWLTRAIWLFCRKRGDPAAAAARLPTPRLAAGIAVDAWAGMCDRALVGALESRRRAGGGFVPAPDAGPDLLATAAARFALSLARPFCGGGTEGAACGLREDLSFVEACWLGDGLFGPAPAAARGDAEHTFYGLLALGACRAEANCVRA